MRRWLLGFLFSLWSTIAAANVPCTLPFTLTNGTTADATQVMANYNALVTCLASVAAAGANTDITALLGLTTPLAPAAGGSNVFLGGTSTGSGNSQVLASPVPSGFTLANQSTVIFVAGFSNTGATQLNVAGTGLKNVYRQTATGPLAMTGGEIVAGQTVSVFYDGTQYEMLTQTFQGSVQPCTEINYQGVVVPTGYLAENGSAVSRTTYATLFSCLAYTSVAATTVNSSATVTVPNNTLFQIGWSVGGNNVTCNSTITAINVDGVHITINNTAGAGGATTLTIGPFAQGDCSTTFNLPNMQGRDSVMVDTAGGTLSSTACTNPATIGTSCGSTTQTILTTNLPAYTPAGTITNGAITFSSDVNSAVNGGAASIATHSTSGTPGQSLTAALGPSQATSTFAGSAQGGHSTPFLLQPVGLLTKAIKY